MKLVGAIPIKFLQSRKIKGQICINLLIDCGALPPQHARAVACKEKGRLRGPFC
jgi:hypothetical protein